MIISRNLAVHSVNYCTPTEQAGKAGEGGLWEGRMDEEQPVAGAGMAAQQQQAVVSTGGGQQQPQQEQLLQQILMLQQNGGVQSGSNMGGNAPNRANFLKAQQRQSGMQPGMSAGRQQQDLHRGHMGGYKGGGSNTDHLGGGMGGGENRGWDGRAGRLGSHGSGAGEVDDNGQRVRRMEGVGDVN